MTSDQLDRLAKLIDRTRLDLDNMALAARSISESAAAMATAAEIMKGSQTNLTKALAALSQVLEAYRTAEAGFEGVDHAS